MINRRSTSSGKAAFNPPRGANSGTGKQKRLVVSTMGQSLRRGGRSRNETMPNTIPAGVTGTGEQGS
ncbi:MAG TPA: hypothetical protein VN515_02340 [Terriglobales bacterium]|nr:hypothetical protein [Terriglobales bacterium]